MNPRPAPWRRLLPAPALSLIVVAFWLLMSDSFTLGQLLLGMLLGVVVPLFAARLDREFARIGTLRPLPRLLCVMLWDILVSNLRVAMQVLGPERKLRPGFIWVPLDLTNIHGISALTSVITLTPGTVTAELSKDRRYLLVHCLDIDDPQHMVDDIKRRYEAPLRKVFP